MPVYPKGPSKWRVRIWFCGKRQDWIVDGTKKEAEAFEARERVKLEESGGLVNERVAPKFLAFCAGRYTKHAEANLKARTWMNRQYTIATLAEFFGDMKLTAIATSHGVDYQRRRLRDGVQPSTINDEVKVLRAILNHAHYLKMPAAKLEIKDLPTRRKRRLLYWDERQVATILGTLGEMFPDLYWISMLLLETGARKGEALALEFGKDVDTKRAFVRIQPNEEWQPKDGEAREVPLDRSGQLLAWLKDEEKTKRRFVFASRNGDRFAFWPQRRFDIARLAAGHDERCTDCKKAEAPKWMRAPSDVGYACAEHEIEGGPHTTRHTFATHFLARCPDLYLLGKLLGHSHERVTKLYAHLLPEHLERARGAVSFAAPYGLAEMKARAKWGENV